MIDSFIETALAQIDDLAELKVSLVALRVLERKQSETASVTLEELARHPALRQGLGFAPDLALESALKRAVARGTLLRVTSLDPGRPRYLANTEAARRVVETIEASSEARIGSASVEADAVSRVLAAMGREVERLEAIEAYPATPEDRHAAREWLAQGYAAEELLAGVASALSLPRPKGTPHRGLCDCAGQISAQPPAAPSAYYRVVVAGSERPADEIVAFRELACRWPTGHEFDIVRSAVGLFGARATIQVLKRMVRRDGFDVDDLIPLLAEEEDAQLALTRQQAAPDLLAREIVQLYESTFGLPPTSHIAGDIVQLAGEIADLAVWRGVFEYAAQQNKRDWTYLRKMLLNPSPAVFLPAPANETAQFAFNEYKRRVSRGVLDASVAREINDLAQRVTDPARWTQAIDAAAGANALNWNYIKAVLSGEPKDKSEVKKDGQRKRSTGTAKRGAGFRRPQVEESTAEEREAAREAARKRIEERARQRATKQG